MNIIYSSDNNYVNYLLVSMGSLLDNTDKFVHFHILDCGIDDDSKQLIFKTLINRNCKIDLYDLSDMEVRLDFIKIKSIAISAYGRLFISRLLSPSIDKCLYLDADSYVNGDIYNLYCQDFDGKTVCAVLDLVPSGFKTIIDIDNPDEYFNSGMMLIDLKKVREENHFERYFEILKSYSGQEIPHHDQGVMNICYNGDVKHLHPKYNCMTPYLLLSYDKIRKIYPNGKMYNEYEVFEARTNPIFVHLTQSVVTRPWVDKSKHPFAKKYNRYLSKLEVSHIPDKRNIRVKIFSWWILNMPMSLVNIAFSLHSNYKRLF